MNPFVDGDIDASDEGNLVIKAQRGEADALEELIKLHQPWVFNIVLRMVPDFHEAEDLCQDILLKSCMKLASFRGDSRFRTWLYRIAVNHVLDMRETACEKEHRESSGLWADDDAVNARLGGEPADPRIVPADVSLLVKEVMIKCTMGMLLCLNRRQRIVFILGGILGVSGRTGSEILGVSEESFRQTLSRSRSRLYNYLNDRCGLLNPDKPCTCARSLPSNMRSGYIDPLRLAFNAEDAPAIRDIVSRARERLANIEFKHCRDLYRGQPFEKSPDFSKRVLGILRSADVRGFLDMMPAN